MKAIPLAAAILLAPDVAAACAPAPPHGHEVIVAAEEAIIAWDPQSRTEHFVRRAQFESTAKDFGFLVPTPAPPTLAEADARAFERLADATRPAVKEETEIEPHFSCLSTFMLRAKSGAVAEAPVRVLSIEHVAGYEAAILQADDAEALRQWLDKNGYEARPALTAWLSPYVASKWTVTAFKIADPSGGGRPASSAVRMTFSTDKPFYPYREPSDPSKATSPPRTLRVFLISTAGRFEGAIGKDAQRWPGDLRYARSTAGLGALLAGAIPNAPDTAWLHDFVDPSTPRPGVDDLFFTPSPAQAEVVPPPEVHVSHSRVYIPLDLAVIVGLGALLFVRLGRRRS